MDLEIGQPYVKSGKMKAKAPAATQVVTQYAMGDDMIATIVPLVACGATLGIVYYMYKELQKTKETQYQMEQTLKHTNTQLNQLTAQASPPVEVVEERKVVFAPDPVSEVMEVSTLGGSMVTLPENIEDVEDTDSDSDTEVVELISR